MDASRRIYLARYVLFHPVQQLNEERQDAEQIYF